jgi:hypothetical protein
MSEMRDWVTRWTENTEAIKTQWGWINYRDWCDREVNRINEMQVRLGGARMTEVEEKGGTDVPKQCRVVWK